MILVSGLGWGVSEVGGVHLALLNDGEVGGQERVQTVCAEAQQLCGIFVGEVVKEDAADATRLLAVLDVEVVVAPLFEAGVVVGVVAVAGVLEHLVEVDCVLVKEVAGGKIGAAAEPPRVGRAVLVHGLKVAVVEVHSGGHGVLWMQHQAQPRGKELDRVKGRLQRLVVRAHGLDSTWRELSIDDRDVDASLLKDVSVLKDTGGTSASALALPDVGLEL